MKKGIEHLRSIARKGGLARIRKHGNPGTVAGRKKGAIQSLKTHRTKSGSPFVAKNILTPKKSPDLAELIGIVLGDGGLTKFQLVVYVELAQEKKYAQYIESLIKKLFDSPVSLVAIPSRGVIRIICARKKVAEFLLKNGLLHGSKVLQQSGVPMWVKRDLTFRTACLRGLIDTDGSVYTDTHRIKTKTYRYSCVAFSNASEPLIAFVYDTLRLLGYRPTKGLRQVFLRRSREVVSYMEKVGTRNAKHLKRFRV